MVKYQVHGERRAADPPVGEDTGKKFLVHWSVPARETDTVPAVNQVELHPHLPQEQLRAYHAEHGILTEA